MDIILPDQSSFSDYSLDPPSVLSYIDDCAMNSLCAFDAFGGDPVGDGEQRLNVLGHFLSRLFLS